MVPAVEGTSLSSLTYLASEPPLNPNDARLRYASIVLYIARVPGSKGRQVQCFLRTLSSFFIQNNNLYFDLVNQKLEFPEELCP